MAKARQESLARIAAKEAPRDGSSHELYCANVPFKASEDALVDCLRHAARLSTDISLTAKFRHNGSAV